MEFITDLATYIRAGYPIINIVSGEEDRAIDRLEDLLRRPELQKQPRQFLICSISRGFTGADGRLQGPDESRLPEQALTLVAKHREPALFLFKDFHPYLDEKKNAQSASLLIRLIRDLAPQLKSTAKTLVWLSPVQYIPLELEKDVTLVDMPLPTEGSACPAAARACAPRRWLPNGRSRYSNSTWAGSSAAWWASPRNGCARPWTCPRA